MTYSHRAKSEFESQDAQSKQTVKVPGESGLHMLGKAIADRIKSDAEEDKRLRDDAAVSSPGNRRS